jgi:hypothetical protein
MNARTMTATARTLEIVRNLVSSPVIMCKGCGNEVRKLTLKEASRLRACDSDAGNSVPVAAFECSGCEVVIFQDEFILDEFIPPQLRDLIELVEAPCISNWSTQKENGPD